MTETCYMCDSAASSMEHAPARCVFPEQKDADGKDYRQNLITVPSCEAHNSAKSKDDEYLMMVISSYFQNNQAAQGQIKGKISRAWARAPGLSSTVVKNFQRVHTGHGQQYAYEVDTDRFDRSLAWCANALFYHIHHKRVDVPFKVISYPLVQLQGEDGAAVNSGRARIMLLASQLLSGAHVCGANPEVFWFQLSPAVEERTVLRMCFFGGFQVVTISSATLEA